MIQILKIEGISNSTCLASLDSTELFIKDQNILLPHNGVLSLQFVSGSQLTGGVMFPTKLLQDNGCQYIPIFNPPLYIDNFPDEVEPPRILVNCTKVFSTCASVSSLIQNSEPDTAAVDEDDLESLAENYRKSIDFTQENDSKSLKKRIVELEFELENINRDHQIEIQKVKREMQKTIDKLCLSISKGEIAYNNTKIACNDIASQRDCLEKMLENKKVYAKEFEEFSARVLQEHQYEKEEQEKIHENLIKKYEQLAEDNISLKRENNSLQEKIRIISSKYSTAIEKSKVYESYIEFFISKETMYSNVLSTYPNLHIDKLTEQLSSLVVTYDNLQKTNFTNIQELQQQTVKLGQSNKKGQELEIRLKEAASVHKYHQTEIEALKEKVMHLEEEKMKLDLEIDKAIATQNSQLDEIEDLTRKLEDIKEEKIQSEMEANNVYENHKVEIEGLKEKLRLLEEEKSNLCLEMEKVQKDYQIEIKELNEKFNSELEEVNSAHKSEIENLSQKLASLEEEKAVLNREQVEINKTHQSEIEALESRLASLEEKNSNLHSDLDTALQTHHSEKETLEQKLSQLEEEKTKLKSEIAEANQAYQAKTKELEEKLFSLEEEKSNLDSELEAAYQSHQAESESLKENIASLEEINNKLDAELNKVSSTSQAEIESLKKKLLSLEEEKNKIELELDKTNSVHKYHQTEIGNLKEKLLALEEEKIKIDLELEKALSKNKENQAEIEELNDKMASIKEEKIKLDLELNKTLSVHKYHQTEIKELKEKLMNFEEEKIKIDQEKEALSNQFFSQNEEISNYQCKIDSLTADISYLQKDLQKANEDKIQLSQEIVNMASSHNQNDPDIVEKILKAYLIAGGHPNNFVKLSDGVYCYGNKKVGISIKNGGLVVRVGGGYMYIEEFLKVYVPPENPEDCSPNRLLGSSKKLFEHIEELDSSIADIGQDITNSARKSSRKSPIKSPFKTPNKRENKAA